MRTVPDSTTRRALLDTARTSGVLRATPGPSAARSQDFLAEALLVATRRNIAEELSGLIGGLGFEVAPVTPASARRISRVYQQWGNLYVGGDFAKTDIPDGF